MANPNCPKEFQKSHASLLDSPLYRLAVATHGDLSDKGTIDALTARLGLAATRDETIAALCRRKSLTPLFAEKLAATVTNESDYNYLSKTEAHQEFSSKQSQTYATENYLFAAKPNPPKFALRLSPSLDTKTVSRIFEDCKKLGSRLNESEEKLRALAAHPSATKEMVDYVLADTALRDGFQFTDFPKKSPHAEYGLMEMGKKEVKRLSLLGLASNHHTSAEGLKHAFQACLHVEGATSNLASHARFPWTEIPLDYIISQTHETSKFEVYCAAHLSGKVPQKELDKIPAKYACAALLDPSLSSLRLEKLAREIPEVATIAAIHPNGRELHFEQETANANIASQIRSQTPVPILVGKSAQKASAQAQIVL